MHYGGRNGGRIHLPGQQVLCPHTARRGRGVEGIFSCGTRADCAWRFNPSARKIFLGGAGPSPPPTSRRDEWVSIFHALQRFDPIKRFCALSFRCAVLDRMDSVILCPSALFDRSSAVFGPMPSLPPLDILANRLPARDPNAITVDGWLLYPTLRVYSLYSDNLFLSPQSPISSPGFGVTPSLAAVWSNGIHTTTLYGNIDRQVYPNDNDVNTLDGRAGFVQRYEAMRDLIFSFNGNYAHQTWASGLQNSIQTPTRSADNRTLCPMAIPFCRTERSFRHPVSRSDRSAPLSGSTIPLVVNPSNQYTGTFSVDKIFNRGILSLSGSVNRTDYENQNQQPSSNSRTLTEHIAFWLGPLFYVYSNGSVGTVVTDTTSTSPNLPQLHRIESSVE